MNSLRVTTDRKALAERGPGAGSQMGGIAFLGLLSVLSVACGVDFELTANGSTKTTVRDQPALTTVHHIALVKFALNPLVGGEGNDPAVATSAVRASYQAKLNEVMKSQEFSSLAVSEEFVDALPAFQTYQKLNPPLEYPSINEKAVADVCGILGVDALLMVSATFDTKAEVNLNALVVDTNAELIGKGGKPLWSYSGQDKLGVNAGHVNEYTIASVTESAAKRLMRSLAKDIKGQR